jgi:mono/diheme cytochrome c family protein
LRGFGICVIDLGLRLLSRSVVQIFLISSVATSAVAGQAATRALTTGEAIYQAGCAGCHGPDGKGMPDTTVGFEKPETFPDFTDCNATTRELDVDWFATIHAGGQGRGFSRIMPSFAEALAAAQIKAVVEYLRGFCRDTPWPRGELNLPRPLTTEKAYPEDETVITTTVDAHQAPDVSYELVYERRIGARSQLEVSVPFASVHDENGAVAHGVGDVGVGLKRVLFANANAIVSAQGEVIMPTGDKARGLGSGTTVFEAFGSYGQLLPASMFLQVQVGTEQPTSTEETPRAAFGHFVVGTRLRQELGFGRLWAPMLEVIADRDFEDGARTNFDLLPQFQVTLNRRQHVRANLGVQFPVNNTAGRSKQVLFYVLWDWFDGGLLDGWK